MTVNYIPRASHRLSEEQAALVRDLPPDVLPLFLRLRRLERRQRIAYFRGFREIGEACAEGLAEIEAERESRGEEMFSADVVRSMSEAMCGHRRHLYRCMSAASAYTDDEYRDLISWPFVVWNHVTLLIEIDELIRRRLQPPMIRERWSPEELGDAIMAAYNSPPQPRLRGGPRLPRIPRTLQLGISRLKILAEQFRNKLRYVLFGQRFDVADLLAGAAVEDVPDEAQYQVTKSIEFLDEIAELARTHADRLRDALQQFADRHGIIIAEPGDDDDCWLPQHQAEQHD